MYRPRSGDGGLFTIGTLRGARIFQTILLLLAQGWRFSSDKGKEEFSFRPGIVCISFAIGKKIYSNFCSEYYVQGEGEPRREG